MFGSGTVGRVTPPVSAWLVRHPRRTVLFDTGALPTFSHDLDEQRPSIARLRRLRDNGATIIPGHDIGVVKSMPPVLGANGSS